jgi:hypothetical protein
VTSLAAPLTRGKVSCSTVTHNTLRFKFAQHGPRRYSAPRQYALMVFDGTGERRVSEVSNKRDSLLFEMREYARVFCLHLTVLMMQCLSTVPRHIVTSGRTPLVPLPLRPGTGNQSRTESIGVRTFCPHRLHRHQRKTRLPTFAYGIRLQNCGSLKTEGVGTYLASAFLRSWLMLCPSINSRSLCPHGTFRGW